MGTDIQIVQMTEAYIEGYHHCLDAVARERRYLAFVEALPLAASRTYVLSMLASGAPQYVALRDAQVVGWCDITPHRFVGMMHCGSLGMGVLSDFRGQGIGLGLITHALNATRAGGLERVELEVFASNMPAIRLYEKVGFIVEGVKRKARKLDGLYDDIVEMALFLVSE